MLYGRINNGASVEDYNSQKSLIDESGFIEGLKKHLQSAGANVQGKRSKAGKKNTERGAKVVDLPIKKQFLHSHTGPSRPANHSARVSSTIELSTSVGQTDLIGQSVQ